MVARGPLSLCGPEPAACSGDRTAFTWLHQVRAGAVRRSPIDVPAGDIRDLAFELIRVFVGRIKALLENPAVTFIPR